VKTLIRKIAVITTSRADYGHLFCPLRDLSAHPQVNLQLIVLGAHLSPEFGLTVRERCAPRTISCKDRVPAELGF